MKMKIDIPDEFIDDIVVNTLRRDRMWCRQDLEALKSGTNTLSIVSHDKEEDIALCEQRLESYNVLMEWYAPPGTWNDDPDEDEDEEMNLEAVRALL